MMLFSILKKALNLSAFFIGCSIFYLQSVSADCQVKSYDEQKTVANVVDGDTIILTDKIKIRLIGVNTPEVGKFPKQPEPYALDAKRFVESKLLINRKIFLKYGKQKKDRYKRRLAHVFLENGNNLNALLINKGLAAAIVVPPNNILANCYFDLEHGARIKKLNMWSHKAYKYKYAEKLTTKMTGFKFIKGKVIRVGKSRGSVWLQMAKKFTVRVRKKDFKQFENLKFEQLKNKLIKVRGWIYIWKGELYMQVRHPRMLSIL